MCNANPSQNLTQMSGQSTPVRDCSQPPCQRAQPTEIVTVRTRRHERYLAFRRAQCGFCELHNLTCGCFRIRMLVSGMRTQAMAASALRRLSYTLGGCVSSCAAIGPEALIAHRRTNAAYLRAHKTCTAAALALQSTTHPSSPILSPRCRCTCIRRQGAQACLQARHCAAVARGWAQLILTLNRNCGPARLTCSVCAQAAARHEELTKRSVSRRWFAPLRQAERIRISSKVTAEFAKLLLLHAPRNVVQQSLRRRKHWYAELS